MVLLLFKVIILKTVNSGPVFYANSILLFYEKITDQSHILDEYILNICVIHKNNMKIKQKKQKKKKKTQKIEKNMKNRKGSRTNNKCFKNMKNSLEIEMHGL